LIEATGKKARYVEQTAQRLKLANVEVANTSRGNIIGRPRRSMS